MSVSDNRIPSRCDHPLQASFGHLPLRKYTISPDGFYALSIKCWLGFVWGFIFESNITLLCQENTWKVDLLSVGPRGYFELAPNGLTFSNLSLMGEGFMTVIVSAMSYPIRNAWSLVFPGK